MPRRPPSEVIEYRISLSGKEREALEAWQAKQTGVGMAYGAAAVGIAAALGMTAYAVYWTLNELYGWIDGAKDVIDDAWSNVKDTASDVKDEADEVWQSNWPFTDESGSSYWKRGGPLRGRWHKTKSWLGF